MNSRRITLQTKLLASAGVLLALLVVVSVVGLSSMSRLATGERELYDGAVKPLVDLGVARAKSNEDRALAATYLLTDAAGRKEISTRLAENTRLVDASLARAERTLVTDEGKRSYAQLMAGLARARKLKADVATLADAGRIEAADAVFEQRYEPLFREQVAANFQRLFDSKAKLAQSKADDGYGLYTSRRNLLIALTILAIVIGFATSWFIARGIRRNVVLITRAPRLAARPLHHGPRRGPGQDGRRRPDPRDRPR
jgi:hypothetical protein